VPFGRAAPEPTSSSPAEGTRLDTITGTWVVVREQAGRREIVRQAMRHAWRGYVAHAWGYDELKPVSRQGVDNFGGFGLTIVDSLSTLWLMEMWQVRVRRRWGGSPLTPCPRHRAGRFAARVGDVVIEETVETTGEFDHSISQSGLQIVPPSVGC
jgi:hypothetical protein